jgi:protein-S-isoprenylcysteine O-methyltransferase Ste14
VLLPAASGFGQLRRCIGVLIAWLLLCLVANLMIVPQEERDLGAAFGEVYLQYKNRVPRWLGKAKG